MFAISKVYCTSTSTNILTVTGILTLYEILFYAWLVNYSGGGSGCGKGIIVYIYIVRVYSKVI